MARRERLSAVDTAWLRMDRATNLMMICGVLVFGERVSPAQLRKVVARRFLAFTRFRERPVDGGTGQYWEPVEKFRLDDHVIVTSLPGAAGEDELRNLVSDLMATPLDPARPRWQFHLVTRY